MSTKRAIKTGSRNDLRDGTRVSGKNGSTRRTKTVNRQPQPTHAPKKALKPSNGEKTFRDDARLDRRIIEGMLHDRSTLMSEMAKQGYGNAAVLRRAAELGLSEALIRQVKGVAADLAGERPGRKNTPETLGARTCLCCDRVFLSTGPGNRLCMRCRGGDAGLAQL